MLSHNRTIARIQTLPADAKPHGSHLEAPVAPYAFGLNVIRDRIAANDHVSAGKFALAVARYPRRTLEWLSYLESLRLRVGADAVPFDVTKKVYRHFFSRGFDVAGRIALMRSHYENMLTAFGPEPIRGIWAGGRVELARIPGRSGQRYIVGLFRRDQFKNEGEMTLYIHPEGRPREPLSNLSLTVGAAGLDRPLNMWLGGFQGFRGGKAAVTDATRDLDGLRPKAILMEAAWALAEALRDRGVAVGDLVGVSNAAHALAGPEWEAKADYDAYWREIGGVENADGCFDLPRSAPVFEADMPAKRAKRWRVRLNVRALVSASFRAVAQRADAAQAPAHLSKAA